MATPRDDLEPRQRPWWASPLWIGSAAFLALLLLVGGLVIGLQVGQRERAATPRPPDNTSAAPSQAPTSTSSSQPTPAASTTTSQRAPGGCPEVTPNASGGPLTKAPESTWQIIANGAALPSSAAGPRVTEGQLARCFAPTAEGALLAATNIWLRSYGPEGRRVLDEQWNPKMSEQQRKESFEAGKLEVQVVGFRFVKPIENNQAQIWLILGSVVKGQWHQFGGRMTVDWTGTDWVARGDDKTPVDYDPYGFVPWKA